MQNKNEVIPYSGMIITEDVMFKPGIYDFRGKEGIIIEGKDITVNGNGAVLVGGKIAKKETEEEDSVSLSRFFGTGVYAENVNSVILVHLVVQGFNTGLHLKDCSGWWIEENDFSMNFSDPECGWEEHGAFGGIMLEGCSRCAVYRNRANSVWNGLYLRYSDQNEIKENDFSMCSNNCVKLWRACENIIESNNLSYGLRIKPGEVHARDSAGVLLESGSDKNHFKANDVTYGGDGIFIRVLNGWNSRGNIFEQNDCSYANNNGIESWAAGNTYIRNKANYCSYGFWLGGSDDTLLMENEAAYNGTNFSNAPEHFGNAGIAVVNGSSSHFKMIGNYIHDNKGPGVAISYTAEYPAFHWIIQKNIIEKNKDSGSFRGHGIYLRNAKWIELSGNQIVENEGEAIYKDENTDDVFILEGTMEDSVPQAILDISPQIAAAGEEIQFDASGSFDVSDMEMRYHLEFGDGAKSEEAVSNHVYNVPGFYRVGLSVHNQKHSDIAFFNLYITSRGTEIGTDEEAETWELHTEDSNALLFNDREEYVSGKSSIRVITQKGKEHILVYPATRDLHLDISQKKELFFFMKFHTDALTDWEKVNKKPMIQLCTSEDDYIEYIPNEAYLEMLFAPLSEYKYSWRPVSFDLREPEGWSKHVIGNPKEEEIQMIRIIEGPSSSAVSEFWIDSLMCL